MSDIPCFSANQYASICESLPDPTFILTESGRYAAIFGGKDKRYYHDGSFLLGKRLEEVLVPSKTQWFLQQIHTALSNGQMLVVEYELGAHDILGLSPEGPAEPIWFEGRITALHEQYAGERAVVWVASNITVTKQLQRQLQQQALSDELTGVHNRRFFLQALSRAYAQFREAGVPASLVYFDVDGFKAINDCFGHSIGDQALRDLSAAVERLAGPQDLFCRLGGDEFAMLCAGRGMNDTTALAHQLLHRGREVLKAYATADSTPALSLGMAHFQPGDADMCEVMLRADQALYTSKNQGGHRLNRMEGAAHFHRNPE